jgi:hypothetical protein
LVYRYLIVFSHALVTNLYLKSGHPNIPLNKLKIKDYGTYNIEFWIYVNKLPELFTCNYGETECRRWFPNDFPYWPAYNASDCNSFNNSVGLEANATGFIFNTTTKNLENISFDLYNNGTLTFYNGRYVIYPENDGYHKFPSVMKRNFPVQKWTYVIVSITNNSLVELYINGKLVQSSIYNGPDAINKIVKPLSTESLQFGKQLDAYITELYINPNAIDSTTAWNNYLSGNVSISKLNANLMLTQDGKNSNKIQLL